MTDKYVNNGSGPGETSPSLLERAKQHEAKAWQMLVDLYAPLIYTRCRSHWGISETESEHVGQDVFVAVARKLPDFERQRTGSFRNWLRVVTDNKCKDLLRRKRLAVARGGSSAQAVLKKVADEKCGQSDSDPNLDERALVIQQAIKAVENEFSERDLTIFWSVAVDEEHRQVVAEEFQVSDNVVYLACSRVKKRLREVYEGLIDDDLL